MSDIIGHESILSFFRHAHERGVLSHAYCFAGPAHVGKHAVAEYVARTVLDIAPDKLLGHPDMVYITRERDEKKGTLKKDISINQIRDLTMRFAQSPFVRDGYMVAIIDPAECMSKGAMNALLKTLEEPHRKSLLILVTQDEYGMLPTIRSRCQTIYFAPVETDVMIEGLVARGVDIVLAEEMARDAYGLPGRAVQWVNDAESYTVFLSEKQRFLSLIHRRFYEKIAIIESMFGDKKDHIATRVAIMHILDVWILVARDLLHKSMREKQGEYVFHWSLIDQMHQVKRLLGKNIHPRLVLEHIILNIP